MRHINRTIRISISILTLILISNKSFSQSPDEEYQIGSTFLNKSDYKNALNHFFISYSNHSYDTLNNNYYKLLYSLGQCYFQLNQYDIALIYYERGYSINKFLQTEIDDNTLNKIATTYYRLGKYLNALKIYLEDLSVIRIKYGENSKNYAFATSNIANSYNKLKKFKEAEDYYLITLQKKEFLFGKISVEFSSTLAWLTDLYISTKQFKKAEKFCLELIEIREKLSGNKNYYYQHNLFKLAKVYEGLGDLTNAEIRYNELVSKIELRDSSFQILYFQSLVSLTKIYLQNGDFPKAKTSLLKLQSKGLSKSFPNSYIQYLNVSMVYNLFEITIVL
jgi:tetratricopeptide (TPR) repeat protein